MEAIVEASNRRPIASRVVSARMRRDGSIGQAPLLMIPPPLHSPVSTLTLSAARDTVSVCVVRCDRCMPYPRHSGRSRDAGCHRIRQLPPRGTGALRRRRRALLNVANAPCSWGVIENVAGERDDYAAVLDEMHATGYAGTELGDWGFMPTDPSRLRQELEQRTLKLLASWVSVFLHDPDRHAQSEAEAVRTARLLAEVGGPDTVIVLGNDPYGDPVRTLNA